MKHDTIVAILIAIGAALVAYRVVQERFVLKKMELERRSKRDEEFDRNVRTIVERSLPERTGAKAPESERTQR